MSMSTYNICIDEDNKHEMLRLVQTVLSTVCSLGSHDARPCLLTLSWPSVHEIRCNVIAFGQAGLRSELEIATDEMEKAQQRLAALEREREALQGSPSPTAPQPPARTSPNKLVEESLRNELHNQVQVNSITPFSASSPLALVLTKPQPADATNN